MDNDIMDRCCIIRINSKCWPGSKKLPEGVMIKIAQTGWATGTKKLMDPELIKKPRNIIAKAKGFIQSYSLPFPLPSYQLINKNRVVMVDETLKRNYFPTFNEAVDEIVRIYEDGKEQARRILEPDGLWNELDYPTDIRRTYNFEWQFVVMNTPAKGTILSPEIYEQEVEKMKFLWKETQRLAEQALMQELCGLIDHAIERLNGDGSPKRFHNTLVENFTQFFETFTDRDLFDNDELKKLTTKAKEVLQGVIPDDLRTYPDLQQRVREGMRQLRQMVDDSIIEVPRRVIKVRPTEEAA
jgi:hypothetical protein